MAKLQLQWYNFENYALLWVFFRSSMKLRNSWESLILSSSFFSIKTVFFTDLILEHPLIMKTDCVSVTEEMLLIRLARLIMVVLNSLIPVRITEDLSLETALKGD